MNFHGTNGFRSFSSYSSFQALIYHSTSFLTMIFILGDAFTGSKILIVWFRIMSLNDMSLGTDFWEFIFEDQKNMFSLDANKKKNSNIVSQVSC